jgi:protein-tyrosine phosphatase
MYRIRPWLYIGKYIETTNPVLLSSCEIGAMLQLAESVQQRGVESLYIPVDDGIPLAADKIKLGVAFVLAQKAAGKKVLVACGAGISRSVTYTIAALKEEENLSMAEAYRQILDVHPDALPHMALWESLRRYYGETVTCTSMWDEIMNLRRSAR